MELIILIVVGFAGYFIYSSLKKNKEEKNEESNLFTIQISYQNNDDYDQSTPSVNASEVWIPKGQSVNVAGYEINNGLIYVGEGLKSVKHNYYPEPSLINPKLEINKEHPDRSGNSMTYWPSYSEITPEAHSAYLEWLASGRKNPTAYIGYVFLFFYGLERRLLIDTETSDQARSEASEIIMEVERLLDIYGNNGSFNGYASNFLDIARLKFTDEEIDITNMPTRQWGEYPLSLKVALSRFSMNQSPIPPKYALIWAQYSPNINFRTPVSRCREEFEKLFEVRYKQKFGDGIVVKPNKTNIKVEYRPATNSFYFQNYEIASMPDVTRLTKPINQFREIIELCTDELDAYSRFVGRKPDEKTSLEALSLLPQELLSDMNEQKIIQLQNWLSVLLNDVDSQYVESIELLNHWNIATDKNLTKTQCISIAQLLGKLGYSMEPDTRFTSNKIDPKGYVIISSLSDNSLKTTSKEYLAATTLLQLASAVSAADGNVSEEEELYLESHLENVLKLAELEKIRLRLYLKWLLITKPEISGIKRKLVSLDNDSKKSIAQFLLSVAFADGVIDPGEIRILKKIYGFLELESESIYSDLHKLQSRSTNDPVTIQTKPNNAQEFSIPKEQTINNGTIILDPELISRKRDETNIIQAKLVDIFNKEDNEVATIISDLNQITVKEEGILGLDKQHAMLVKELLDMDSVDRSDFEILCNKYGLMPDGAIETINSRSFEQYDEALIEEDEDIQINEYIRLEIAI